MLPVMTLRKELETCNLSGTDKESERKKTDISHVAVSGMGKGICHGPE